MLTVLQQSNAFTFMDILIQKPVNTFISVSWNPST